MVAFAGGLLSSRLQGSFCTSRSPVSPLSVTFTSNSKNINCKSSCSKNNVMDIWMSNGKTSHFSCSDQRNLCWQDWIKDGNGDISRFVLTNFAERNWPNFFEKQYFDQESESFRRSHLDIASNQSQIRSFVWSNGRTWETGQKMVFRIWMDERGGYIFLVIYFCV